MNALLQPSTLPFGAIPFNQFKIEDYVPSIDTSILEAKKNLEKYKSESGYSFDQVIIPLMTIMEQVEYISTIFFNLHSAECSDALQAIAPEISSKVTALGSDLTLDPVIFKRVKACYEHKGGRVLTKEETTILEETYRSFIRNGANLDDQKKDRLRVIDEESAKVSLQFSQNVLKSQNAFELIIDDKEKLSGLPDSFLEAASDLAEKKGHPGKWFLTLDVPMVVPVLNYAKNRELRKKIFMAYNTKAQSGEYNNQPLILQMLKLRKERAQLLGYNNHAEFILEERMAQTPAKVISFLNELLDKALPQAQKEMEKLKNLALEVDGLKTIERYDVAYYSEILKQRELKFDNEQLRPYFPLENVIKGVFKVAGLLYKLEFKERKDLPVYHPDVIVYEVHDPKHGYLGLFYADFFPRETKRAGAWMTNYKPQGLINGKVERPHVGIVCNFTKPTKSKPSLLTLDEVLTLYHEFGHALHGMLSQCQYTKVSGPNVYWDFVELPSQIMENWIYEKECLDLFAAHFETGEKISSELMKKIKDSSNFLEGMGTMRQVTFSLLDMQFHLANPEDIKDVIAFEKSMTQKTALLPEIEGTSFACAFSHIFAGGYSAGYYSYKWAEVLDADAFEYFLEKGIFNPEVAQKFREHILEKGGSEHPMELYKRFRGSEPKIESLLKRSGLLN
jgi:peptidyl-dipeptidase Dcp